MCIRDSYYALPEQHGGRWIADVLTLQVPRSASPLPPVSDGGLAVLDLEPQIFDHAVVLAGRLALGGQVVADEERIGGKETQRLQRAELDLAAGGDPQLAAGISQTD